MPSAAQRMPLSARGAVCAHFAALLLLTGCPQGPAATSHVSYVPTQTQCDSALCPPATAECQADSDCAGSAGVCELARCSEQKRCVVQPAASGSACTQGTENRTCQAGACVAACGDGIVQAGESCDDHNIASGDGCRADCVVEEAIGAGFSGGQCAVDSDCAPAGSRCLGGPHGGTCVVECASGCADRASPPTPETFCIAASVFNSRSSVALPADIDTGVCVAKCDFDLFPTHGCRSGMHCERRSRPSQSTTDSVCVPGPWSTGLQLSSDGKNVVGIDSNVTPAEPYASLLERQCNGTFTPVATELFYGLARFELAERLSSGFERLCSAPSNLPNVHGTHAMVSGRQSFRLLATRAETIAHTSVALYGRARATQAHQQGPLYRVRTMTYANDSAGTYYLYADAGEERPSWDPDRARHFGMVNGREWMPLDEELEPDVDYKLIKASTGAATGAAFGRQWGRVETVTWIGNFARAFLLLHAQLLGVGDLSLPTGGVISDHGSHENGVDADLYLLTFNQDESGHLDTESPNLWISECTQGSSWTCWYKRNGDGAKEPAGAAVPAASLLRTVAQYAYDHGPHVTHVVQNDVVVLAPFRQLPSPKPSYVDESNYVAAGWPLHANHAHLRFSW